MKNYFLLQISFFERRFEQAGFNFKLAIILLLGALGGLSYLLYQKTNYAGWILSFMALSFCLNLSHKLRTEFLQITFANQLFRKIRLLENLTIILPFLIVFVVFQDWISALVLCILSILFSQLTFGKGARLVIPSPFGLQPFEFLLGFRRYFWILPLAIGFILIGWKYANFNLAIVAFAVMGLFSLQFYGFPEDEWYVWNEAKKPVQFLRSKLTISTKHFIIWMFIPLMLMLSLFPTMFLFTILGLFASILFVWTIIAAKYARFPNEINFVDMLLMAFCIACPPLIILMFLYFYKSAKDSLKSYLK